MSNASTRHFPLLHRRQRTAARRGAMLVLIAVCMPIFLIMAMFAVDLAYMELVRAELRTATDAASRAGTNTLTTTQDEVATRNDAKDAAQRNLVAGEPLLLSDSEINIGWSNQSNSKVRYTFINNGFLKNSVQVIGNRTQGSLSGSVNLFFGKFLGHDTFQPTQVAISTKIERDLALVLDRSGSMSGQGWTELDTAVGAFLDTLELTPQDEMVSLATFNDTGHYHHDLSLNYTPIRTTMSAISPSGKTAVGEGMEEGMVALSAQPRLAEKALIVITDGIHNTGVDPLTVAQAARTQGMIVYTITFGAATDQAGMQAVAAAGGGKHWHAPGGAALTSVFQEIANSNRTLITE